MSPVLFPVLCPNASTPRTSQLPEGYCSWGPVTALRGQGHSPPQPRGFSCPQLPVTTPGTLHFSPREYAHPGHPGGHDHPGYSPPQLPGHRCRGMLGGAAARPQRSPDCCLPVQAQPRRTCPQCAMAARWWTPQRHPCEGWGARLWRCHMAPPPLPEGEQCPQHGPLRCQMQPGGSVPVPARATHPTCWVMVRVTLPLH